MGAVPWSDSLSADRTLEMWKGRAMVMGAVGRRRAERGRVRVRNDISGSRGCGEFVAG